MKRVKGVLGAALAIYAAGTLSGCAFAWMAVARADAASVSSAVVDCVGGKAELPLESPTTTTLASMSAAYLWDKPTADGLVAKRAERIVFFDGTALVSCDAIGGDTPSRVAFAWHD